MDLPGAALDTCSESVPSNATCNIECATGTQLEGSGRIQCRRGQWVVNGTRCVGTSDAFETGFRCKALSEQELAHVDPNSCRGTPGRQNTGYEAPDFEIQDWSRDLLSVTRDYDDADRRVPCMYTCADGYHPSETSPTVLCDLGAWVANDTGEPLSSTVAGGASCTARSCD